MSPRSEEYATSAAQYLEGARVAARQRNVTAAHSAYYACFLIAKAALSERDAYSRSHGGTWDLFFRHFVADGPIDRALAAEVRKLEKLRLDADDEAVLPDDPALEEAMDTAERFVAAVQRLMD